MTRLTRFLNRPETRRRRHFAAMRGFAYGCTVAMVLWTQLPRPFESSRFGYGTFVASDGSLPRETLSMRIGDQTPSPRVIVPLGTGGAYLAQYEATLHVPRADIALERVLPQEILASDPQARNSPCTTTFRIARGKVTPGQCGGAPRHLLRHDNQDEGD